MNMTIENARELYRLKHMARYNTWPRIQNESVAEHSFYVALFTLMLCEEFGVNHQVKSYAFEIAIVHDVPEAIMNDITYDAKRKIPEINEPLKKFEKSYIKKNFPKQYDLMFEFTEDEEILLARELVHLADAYSVAQYCDNEVMLGNKYFKPLYSLTKERVNKILKNIERRFGIACQKIMI